MAVLIDGGPGLTGCMMPDSGAYDFAKVADNRETTVVSWLIDQSAARPIRAWLPRCYTGDEAYWLAVLFLEQYSRVNRAPNFQIFASVQDAETLAAARRGFCPISIYARMRRERQL